MATSFPLESTPIAVAWILAIAVVASVAVAGVAARRGASRGSIIDRVLVVWLVAALSAVAVLTLQPGPQGFGSARPSILTPFTRIDRQDAIANTLLYIPVGLFAALLWRSTSSTIVRATGFAAAVSFGIEFAQWVLPIDRAATTHDVIFNTLGGFVGAVLGTLIIRVAGSLGRSAAVENDRT